MDDAPADEPVVAGRPSEPADLREGELARHGLPEGTVVVSLERARALLPQARRVVAVLQSIQDGMTSIMHEVQVRLAVDGGEDDPGVRELQEQADLLRADWDEQMQRLRKVDCSLKGLDPPLLDWYGVVDGRLVELCWREGEPTVEHWHPLGAGFAGRRMVLEA